MGSSLGLFALQALHPEVLSGRRELSCPDFLNNSEKWNALFAHATRLHALPTVASSVRNAPWFRTSPRAVQAETEAILTRGRMLQSVLQEELAQASRILDRERIPYIILKGMDLAYRTYPNPLQRPCTDVDLLVPPTRFERAMNALLSSGYQMIGALPKRRFRIELARSPELPVIELHQALQAGDSPELLAGIWERAQNTRDVSGRGLALSAEDQLPYLIRHAAVQHALESPLNLLDLHFLIESPDFRSGLPWEQVLENIEERGIYCASWFVLNFIKREYGTRVPESFLSRLKGRCAQWRRWILSRRSARAEDWFPLKDRSLAWLVSTRFLLRDRPSEALLYGLRRSAPRMWGNV